MILVSACLCGENCKYNGKNNYSEAVLTYAKKEGYVLVCPEVLGGLSTPRIPSEIVGGTGKEVLIGQAKVESKTGEDVTKAFKKGAEQALALAKKHHITKAILKAKSPSCGKGKVYDGTFTGKLTDGDGVTAALLAAKGIKVLTEEEIIVKS